MAKGPGQNGACRRDSSAPASLASSARCATSRTGTCWPSLISTRSWPPAWACTRASTGCPTSHPTARPRRTRWPRTALAELAAASPAASAAPDIAATPPQPQDPRRANGDGGDERRCARLLRERLEAGLARSAAGEPLRSLSNIFGPVHSVRSVFLAMPTATADDWAVIARRMAEVPAALAGIQASLAEGARRGLLAAPRQVRTVIGQLQEWSASAAGRGWFAGFARDADVPAPLRAELDQATAAAMAAYDGLARWLAGEYLAQAEGTPDGVGEERYRLGARYWTGADLDPADEYAWGWQQFLELREEMHDEAQRVLRGSTALEAMRYLDRQSEAVHGTEEIRRRLQKLMDDVIADLQGTHFDLADPLLAVEARIAPDGQRRRAVLHRAVQGLLPAGTDLAADPGADQLPDVEPDQRLVSRGRSRPSHAAGPVALPADRLSLYQTSVGGVSACSEGWALYAERLMDELGYLGAPGARLGYLDAQMMRAVRVIVDIGMHLGLAIPGDSPVAPAAPGPRRWPRSSSPRTAAGTSSSSRARSSATCPRPARRSATSWGAGLAGGPGGGQEGPRRHVQPQGMAWPRCRSAHSASTT